MYDQIYKNIISVCDEQDDPVFFAQATLEEDREGRFWLVIEARGTGVEASNASTECMNNGGRIGNSSQAPWLWSIGFFRL